MAEPKSYNGLNRADAVLQNPIDINKACSDTIEDGKSLSNVSCDPHWS